jgi:hypothetical protein
MDFNMTENAYWTEARKKFDDEEVKMDTFKTWQPVLDVPLYSYSQFEAQYGEDILKILPQDQAQRDLWKGILKEPFLGHTEESYNYAKRFIAIDNAIYETTPWAMKSAHHVLSYLHHTGRDILDFEQIVEFGPGIGETCRIINDLGFKGDYFLYDLPEVLKVSTYYNKDYPNVKRVTHYSQVPDNKKTLFIGTWSISETPLDYRDEVFTYFNEADYLLIYQVNAFEYANNPYFMIKFPQLVNRNVKIVPIPWLAGIADGNNYLFIE